jgi:hypothetical protein
MQRNVFAWRTYNLDALAAWVKPGRTADDAEIPLLLATS